MTYERAAKAVLAGRHEALSVEPELDSGAIEATVDAIAVALANELLNCDAEFDCKRFLSIIRGQEEEIQAT